MAEEKNKEDVIEPQTPETPKSAAAQAEALIRLKKKTDQELLNIKELKDSLKPVVRVAPIRTPSGTVSFVTGSAAKFLDKDLVRNLLVERLHVSPEVADQFIDAGSTEKVIASYVKVTPE